MSKERWAALGRKTPYNEHLDKIEEMFLNPTDTRIGTNGIKVFVEFVDDSAMLKVRLSRDRAFRISYEFTIQSWWQGGKTPAPDAPIYVRTRKAYEFAEARGDWLSSHNKSAFELDSGTTSFNDIKNALPDLLNKIDAIKSVENPPRAIAAGELANNADWLMKKPGYNKVQMDGCIQEIDALPVPFGFKKIVARKGKTHIVSISKSKGKSKIELKSVHLPTLCFIRPKVVAERDLARPGSIPWIRAECRVYGVNKHKLEYIWLDIDLENRKFFWNGKELHFTNEEPALDSLREQL